MNILTSSVCYQAVLRTGRWLRMTAGYSLVGRFLAAWLRTVVPVFADSRTFGTRYLSTRPLGREGHPLCVLALSRPYLWLRAKLGSGAVGRAVAAWEGALRQSHFARGEWVRVVGAGLFGLGCGRLALLLPDVDLRLLVPLIMLLLGLVMWVAGSRLASAFRWSLVGRGLGLVAAEGPRCLVEEGAGTGWGAGEGSCSLSDRAVRGVAALLAAAAGVAAGLTAGGGAWAPVIIVVGLCLFGLVVLRPEAILVIVAAFPWLDWLARQTLGGLGPAWDDALLIFSLLLLLWSVIVLRRGELWTVPIVVPTLLALTAALGSVVVRAVPGDVALFALRVLFQPLLFYFLGFLFPKNRSWVRGAVAVFLLASAALAVHGLYQYFTGAPMPAKWVDVRETGISTRAYSIVQNPNGLGAFLLLGTLISLSLALRPGLPRRPRLWLGVLCAVQLAGIAVTFSRGAWLGLAAGVLALLLLAYRRYLAPVVAAGVVAWFVLPETFINRLTFAFSSTYIAKSLVAGRLYVWKMSLRHMAAHPWFGVGLGTFGGTSAVTFGYGRLWVDNFYLQLGAEGGLLLLVFFLWILLRGAKGLARGHAVADDPGTRALCAGVFGAFIAVAVANVTASVWETLIVGVGFWFMTGLATSAALQKRTGETGATTAAGAEAGVERGAVQGGGGL